MILLKYIYKIFQLCFLFFFLKKNNVPKLSEKKKNFFKEIEKFWFKIFLVSFFSSKMINF
jgi:hypothetical protein